MTLCTRCDSAISIIVNKKQLCSDASTANTIRFLARPILQDETP